MSGVSQNIDRYVVVFDDDSRLIADIAGGRRRVVDGWDVDGPSWFGSFGGSDGAVGEPGGWGPAGS